MLSALLPTLFLWTSLLSPASAQNASLKPAVFRDFSGGYADAIDPLNLDPKFSPDSLNIVIDNPVGSFKPRAGFIQCGVSPSTTPYTTAYVYSRTDGSENLILSDNNTIWSTRDCITFSTITTGLGYNNIPNFALVRDKLWIVNGSTWVSTWNGSARFVLDGVNSTTPQPAPPKARYIAFWKERVWLARTNTEPSAVYFSALEDSGGNDIDPSTGSAAWPATNAIYVDQDAGSAIFGISPYCDQLKVYKDPGRWGIVFNSQFDNAVVKDFANPGTRYQASIVEHEGAQIFVGRDGIYASDCNQAKRISDAIQVKFDEVNQSNVDSSFKTWDLTGDFNAGTNSSTTISADSVFVSSISGVYADFDVGGLVDTSSNPLVCIPRTGYTIGDACGPIAGPVWPGFGPYTVRVFGDNAIDSGTMYIIKKVDGSTLAYTGGTLDVLASGSSPSTFTANTSAFSNTAVFLHFTGGGSHLYTSTFTIGPVLTFQYLNTDRGLNWLDNIQSRLFFSSGVWTSEIYNLVSVSSFSTLEAEHTVNGGAVAYSVRVGTSSTAITQNAYSPITPGALITGTTSDIYIQVKATMTVVSTLDASPEIDYITVNVAQGSGSNQQVHSFSEDGKLYVSASTGASATNNIVFVKAKPSIDAWGIYDWKIGTMVAFGERFYSIASSHTAVNRMNFGTNDNGQPIHWHWTSRDEAWGDPGVKKYLLEITGDYRSGYASNLKVGYSRDFGTTFTEHTVAATNSGRGTFRLFVNGGNANDYRLRIRGSTLDETAVITGLAGWARILNLRE